MRNFGVNPAIRNMQNNTANYEVTQPATYAGVTWKTGVFALITIASALVCRILFLQFLAQYLMYLVMGMVVCAIAQIFMGISISRNPDRAKTLGIVYCVLEGLTLGILVTIVDLYAQGLALAAFLATCGVFVFALLLFRRFSARSYSSVTKFVFISLSSLVAVQLVLFLGLLITGNMNLYMTYFWIQLGISAIMVVYATIVLLMDLKAIDAMVTNGVDKRYEWQASFALITTLIWLYIEILDILLRLVIIFGNRN